MKIDMISNTFFLARALAMQAIIVVSSKLAAGEVKGMQVPQPPPEPGCLKKRFFPGKKKVGTAEKIEDKSKE